MLPKKIINIDNFFAYVSSVIEGSSINPINSTKQKNFFLKNKKNPIFEYKPCANGLYDLRSMLQEISFGKSEIDLVFEKKRKNLIDKIDMACLIGKDGFSDACEKIYPAPDEKLVKIAYEILNLPPSKHSPKISRETTKKIIREAFSVLGIKDWTVLSKDILTSAQVNSNSKTLVLRKNERFYASYVKRLVVHEIGTHVVRVENSRNQMLRLFTTGFAGRLETEEGLAAYSEFVAGLLTTSMLRNYAGRVVAVHYALSHSFIQTYNHLCKYFKSKTAWKLTLRVKRGLCDTSKKGAYTKDVIYLRGFLKILDYVENGGDIYWLYVGRVGINDLDSIAKLEKLGYVNPPEFVPNFFDEFFERNPDNVSKELLDNLRNV